MIPTIIATGQVTILDMQGGSVMFIPGMYVVPLFLLIVVIIGWILIEIPDGKI